MNREERRHPEQRAKKTKTPQEQTTEISGADRPAEEASVRAKSSRHKKSTADKWNQ
jgi:hypothetical protein